MDSMANKVMRPPPRLMLYLYTGFEDQLKTLNVLEILKDLHN